MTNLRPIVLGALAGLSLVAIGWWAKDALNDSGIEKASTSESAPLPDVVDAPVVPVARPATAPMQSAYVAPVPIDPVAFREQSNRDRDAAARKLEAAWNVDAAAPQLATQTEQKLLEAMDTGLASQARFQPISSLPSCRASLCRIEGEFAPGQDGNNWATRLLLDMGGTFGNTTTVQYRQPDGRSQIVLYAFRLGKTPPQ